MVAVRARKVAQNPSAIWALARVAGFARPFFGRLLDNRLLILLPEFSHARFLASAIHSAGVLMLLRGPLGATLAMPHLEAVTKHPTDTSR